MEGRCAVWGPVYQFGGPGLSHEDDCCVYAVDCGSQAALIDAGSGRGLKNILENLQLALPDKELTTVFATHGHIDHIGGLVYLREKYGLKHIIAHRQDSEIIAHGDPQATASAAYGLYYRGAQPTRILGGDEDVQVGDVTFHCLYTPGHTPGSMAIYLVADGKTILFGQDIHGPFHAKWGSDLTLWQESMVKLLQLEADILCEGHAGVIEGKQAVSEYLQSYLARYQG